MNEEKAYAIVGALLLVAHVLIFWVIAVVAPQYFILTMVAAILLYMLIKGD